MSSTDPSTHIKELLLNIINTHDTSAVDVLMSIIQEEEEVINILEDYNKVIQQEDMETKSKLDAVVEKRIKKKSTLNYSTINVNARILYQDIDD